MRTKEHIALENFSLQHSNREAFLTCKCNAPIAYLIWRIFWAVYHLSWLAGNLVVTSLHDDASSWKWFVYLSNWMYLLLTIQCVMEATIVLATRGRKPERDQDAHLPWYIQIMWLLYTVSAVGAVMVCVWYWTFIHKDKRLTAIRFNTHGIAALYVILNMAVTKLPLRLLHFLYPVGFGLAYTLFSFVYYSLGGTNYNGEAYIYSILDWSRPGRTLIITSLSNFVCIPLVHVMLWLLSFCFHKLHDKLRKPQVVYSQRLNSTDAESVDIG